MLPPVRLGVNIDHAATLRNVRGGTHPDPVALAELCIAAGADGITAHLREDRRHIRDEDIPRLRALDAPFNFEMAASAEMQAIAMRILPHACCIVPERRAELTTEGGLNVVGHASMLKDFIAPLQAAGIRVSLFIDPRAAQVEAAANIGADVVEFHTGRWCHAPRLAREAEWVHIRDAVRAASARGMECHAGHGLDFESATQIAGLPQIMEVNIGHFIMGAALAMGLPEVIRKMKRCLEDGRTRLAA